MKADIYFKSLIENHMEDQDFLWCENTSPSMRKGGSISKRVAGVCGCSHLDADPEKSRAVLTASTQTESSEHGQYTFIFLVQFFSLEEGAVQRWKQSTRAPRMGRRLG